MAKKFRATNNLEKYLNIKQAELMLKGNGIKVTKKTVEQELSEYCGTTWENIVMIKRNINPSSIEVSMLICQYFNCKFEDMFELVEVANVETDIDDDKFLEEAKIKLLEVYPQYIITNLVSHSSLYKKLDSRAKKEGKTVRSLVEDLGFRYKNKRKSI